MNKKSKWRVWIFILCLISIYIYEDFFRYEIANIKEFEQYKSDYMQISNKMISENISSYIVIPLVWIKYKTNNQEYRCKENHECIIEDTEIWRLMTKLGLSYIKQNEDYISFWKKWWIFLGDRIKWRNWYAYFVNEKIEKNNFSNSITSSEIDNHWSILIDNYRP